MSGTWHELLDLQRRLRVLSDAYRLRIVQLLAQGGEMTVSEIVAQLGKSQPLVSFHLRLLRKVRLVQKHRRGRLAIYSLNRDQCLQCQHMLMMLLMPTVPAQAGSDTAGEPLEQ